MAMFIDAAATTQETALTQVEVMFMESWALGVSLITVAAVLAESVI